MQIYFFRVKVEVSHTHEDYFGRFLNLICVLKIPVYMHLLYFNLVVRRKTQKKGD